MNVTTALPTLSEDARFWEKVDASGDCWEWTAATNEMGYGIFRIDGRNVRAHRWAWESLVAVIPPQLVMDHLCRNPPCVNPDHLEVVTQQVNASRGAPGKRRWRRLRTHCQRGHAFVPSNIYWYKGYRICRACRKRAAQRARAAR